MSRIPEPRELDGYDGGPFTLLSDAEASADEFYVLSASSWLAVWVSGVSVEFVIYEFVVDLDGEVYGDVVVRGEGVGGNLRELRHTWWGDDGYVFYPPWGALVGAAPHLEKHFDLE